MSSASKDLDLNSSQIDFIKETTRMKTLDIKPNFDISKKNNSRSCVGIKSVILRNKVAPKELTTGQDFDRTIGYYNYLSDIIYFICPEWSIIQCTAIALGLIASALLTIFFLFLGGFWDSKKVNTMPMTISTKEN